MYQWWGSLSPYKKKLWKIGFGVLITGHVGKALLFKHVADRTLENVKREHIKASRQLRSIQTFSTWMEQDTSRKLPELTDTQRSQLRKYLMLRSKKRPDAYPTDSSS